MGGRLDLSRTRVMPMADTRAYMEAWGHGMGERGEPPEGVEDRPSPALIVAGVLLIVFALALAAAFPHP